MIKTAKKHLTLIDNIKDMWKFATFQIAVVIMLLELLQALTDFMPTTVAELVRTILVIALPFARAVKFRTKDEKE